MGQSRSAPASNLPEPRTLLLDLAQVFFQISNATSEGINSKIQIVKQMACGFRNRDHYKPAIHFPCGGLDLYAAEAT